MNVNLQNNTQYNQNFKGLYRFVANPAEQTVLANVVLPKIATVNKNIYAVLRGKTPISSLQKVLVDAYGIHNKCDTSWALQNLRKHGINIVPENFDSPFIIATGEKDTNSLLKYKKESELRVLEKAQNFHENSFFSKIKNMLSQNNEPEENGSLKAIKVLKNLLENEKNIFETLVKKNGGIDVSFKELYSQKNLFTDFDQFAIGKFIEELQKRIKV